MKGELLRSLPLYSEECLELIRNALNVAETSETHASNGTAKSRFEDSSDDDEVSAESSSSSSSSSEESSEPDDEAVTQHDAKHVEPAVTANLSTERTAAPRRNRKPKLSMDERQRKLIIQRHIESLNCMLLPLVPEPAGNRNLELPLALLSKEDRQSASAASMGRSFLHLATNLKDQHPILVLFVRSGRFAAGIFQSGTCVMHTTSTRYTVRKGQGKAQSAQDGQRRPKSMGAQLRRAGEQGLKQDMATTLQEWRHWIQQSTLIWVSCPKTMQAALYESAQGVLTREDPRIRKVPLDLGRPSFENIAIIHAVMTTVSIRRDVPQVMEEGPVIDHTIAPHQSASTQPQAAKATEHIEELPIIPLTPLHEAARDGNLEQLVNLLDTHEIADDIDSCAGEFLMTALHYAAASTTSSTVNDAVAAECVMALLLRGQANPCVVDGRNRPPYFVASADKVRDAFRMARAMLGEDYCNWHNAKVGPPLTDDDIRLRIEKDAEKKRKKKARQKEKKAEDKAQAAALKQQKEEEDAKQKQEEEAKRIRDGLQPKTNAASNVCDYCQKVCTGKRRSQMLQRLEYAYCSTDCVQKHKRELMASAALSRLGGVG